MEGHTPEYWRSVADNGPVQIPAHRGLRLDIRRGLPSLTINGYPDRFTANVVAYLRDWGWLPPYRLTVYVPPWLRRADPSAQSIASYVQSAMLHTERAARGDESSAAIMRAVARDAR